MNDEIHERLKRALDHAEKRGSALESHVAVLKSDVRALIAAQETGVTSTQARITAAIMEGVTQETSEEVLTALSRAAGRVRALLAASTASDRQEAEAADKALAVFEGRYKELTGRSFANPSDKQEAVALPKRGYFVYDPDAGSPDFYDTDAERDAAHREAIKEYREEALRDCEWSPSVDSIVSGIVTHKTVESDVCGDSCDYAPAPAAPHAQSAEQDRIDAEYREVGVWEPNGSKFMTYRKENLNGVAMYVREDKGASK